MKFDDDTIDFNTQNLHEICVHKKLSAHFVYLNKDKMEPEFIPPIDIYPKLDFKNLNHFLTEKINILYSSLGYLNWNILLENFTYEEIEKIYIAYKGVYK